MKNRRIPLRRGSYGVHILLALAVLGLILFGVIGVGLLISGPSTALSEFLLTQRKLEGSATFFEAPATRTIEFKPGAGIVMFSRGGKVGDKRIGSPPSTVTIDVKVTGPDGSAVSYEPNRAPSRILNFPLMPSPILGFFQIRSEGAYTVEVNPSDGTTPAAILVGSASNEEVESITKNDLLVRERGTRGFLGFCGLLMALGFGIPALIIWRRKRNTPSDPIATL
jgi:hypothetical protein